MDEHTEGQLILMAAVSNANYEVATAVAESGSRTSQAKVSTSVKPPKASEVTVQAYQAWENIHGLGRAGVMR